MKKNLNQKLIDLIEYYNLVNINLLLNDKSIKRNSNNLPGQLNRYLFLKQLQAIYQYSLHTF